jgi:hypothetical protein
MGVDGLGADAQTSADLLGVHVLRGQLKALALARRQSFHTLQFRFRLVHARMSKRPKTLHAK